jgi:hypothetical protein
MSFVKIPFGHSTQHLAPGTQFKRVPHSECRIDSEEEWDYDHDCDREWQWGVGFISSDGEEPFEDNDFDSVPPSYSDDEDFSGEEKEYLQYLEEIRQNGEKAEKPDEKSDVKPTEKPVEKPPSPPPMNDPSAWPSL